MADYLRFFPERVRTAPAAEAAEERWSWRGQPIHLTRLPDPAAPVKMLILHGAGGYGGMLMPYARLVEAGTRVEGVAPDLPGYGLTGRSNVDYAGWIDCAADLIEAERARDGRPIVVLGASIGGMTAYSAVARAGAAGLIVTCLLDPRRADVRAAVARFPLLARLPVQGLRPFDPLRIPIKWVAKMSALANDPELNALAAGDPLGGGNRVSLRFLRTYLTSAPEVEPEQFTTCPVLMVHPAADRWTPVGLSLPFFDRIKADKQLVMLDNAGHMPVEEPGLTQMAEAVTTFVNAAVTSRRPAAPPAR